MPIELHCECGQRLRAHHNQAGTNHTCPKCGRNIHIPGEPPVAPPHHTPTPTPAKLVVSRASGEGAEDSVVSYYRADDLELLRYVAAQKGLIASQKAVLLFSNDPQGPDMAWNLVFNTADVGFVCRNLDDAGIEYRSIKTGDGKTGVIVIDIGAELIDNVIGLKEALGSELSVTAINGWGEFIGADTRQNARVEFGKVIAAYESGHPRGEPKLEDDHGGGDGADQQGSAASAKEAAIDQMNALADKADAEGRPMTQAEWSEFYQLHRQMRALYEAM